MILPLLALGLVAFAISWVGTWLMVRIAPKIGFVDKPGGRKIHANPKPLGGGVALMAGICLPVVAGLVAAWCTDPASIHPWSQHLGGIRLRTPMALGILGCLLALHIMGLVDDRKALGPYSKLIIQLLVSAVLVVGFDVRALTALGYIPSVVLSILWITAITNAFNFLDNMDGLSAGIATVCAVALFGASVAVGQAFVPAMLVILIGSLFGFLCFNFPPASIFMGDCGSLIIGFMMGILTIQTTFLPAGRRLEVGWYALLAPAIVLALPLYDLIVVSIIRMARGHSPFKGDTNHFSHRLVARGMSRRTAVLCLYLVSAATSIAAILLTQVATALGAILVVSQTVLVLGVVLLLEQHPVRTSENPTPTGLPEKPER